MGVLMSIASVLSIVFTLLSGFILGLTDQGSSTLTGADSRPSAVKSIDEPVLIGVVVDQFHNIRTDCRAKGDWIPNDESADTNQQGIFTVPTTTGTKVVTVSCVDSARVDRTFNATFPATGGLSATFMVPQSYGYTSINSPYN